MKILALVDKQTSAIGRLMLTVQKNNPHLNIQVVDLHPKRPEIEQIKRAADTFKDCDVFIAAYWKSAEKLRQFVDIRQKPSILCHFNPYDTKLDRKRASEFADHMAFDDNGHVRWSQMYDIVIVPNEDMQSVLGYAQYIHQGIDLSYWKFHDKYTDSKTVQMVSSRIEGKKGVKEVAKACYELGYKFILIGRVSDGGYFEEIMKENPDTDFREDVTEDDLYKSYTESAIHVCNSIDDYESGTTPILEAMAVGVPVLTRRIGHVPDLFNDRDNMIVRSGASNDYGDLKKELKALMENPLLREKIRKNARGTVKNWTGEKMAIKYCDAIYEASKGGEDMPFVSVIVPTFDRPEVLIQCLAKINSQTYPHIEIVVVDSGNKSVKPLIDKFVKLTNRPVKYIYFQNNGEYTLPKARNIGVLESRGGLLVFCDERIGMEPNAVGQFVNHWTFGSWLYGIKDEAPKGFVENFSAVDRKTFISLGMFNERIDCYGGQSQEIRTRFAPRIQFQMINEARAKAIAKSTNRSGKDKSLVRAKLLLFKLYGG